MDWNNNFKLQENAKWSNGDPCNSSRLLFLCMARVVDTDYCSTVFLFIDGIKMRSKIMRGRS